MYFLTSYVNYMQARNYANDAKLQMSLYLLYSSTRTKIVSERVKEGVCLQV